MEEFLSIQDDKIFESEIEEKKSRFLAFAKYVETSEDAEEFYRQMRKKYNDAKHVVYAYRLLNTSRFSDDKEPAGTAGKPILDVVTKLGLYNVIVVVVRYFGGTKLGAGPLLRVYTKSATQSLKPPFLKYQKANKTRVKISFANFQNLLPLASKGEIILKDAEFLEDVFVTIISKKDKTFNFETISNEEIFYAFGGETCLK